MIAVDHKQRRMMLQQTNNNNSQDSTLILHNKMGLVKFSMARSTLLRLN